MRKVSRFTVIVSIGLVVVMGLNLAPIGFVQAVPPQDAVDAGDRGGVRNAHRNDPCDQLRDPPGRALGLEKKCRGGGSSSGIAKGDFNGDGFADLAIGVPEKNTPVGVVNSGAVIVIYGSANGLTTTDPAVPAAQFWSQNTPGVPGSSRELDRFGSALAAGDFNDDGVSDLAIGAPNKVVVKNGVGSIGAVFVIYGLRDVGLTATSTEVPAAQIWAITDLCDENIQACNPPIAANTEADVPLGTGSFGASLAWGDFDGDGVGDLAVGSPEENLRFGFLDNVFVAGAVGILFGVRKTTTSVGGLSAAGSEVRHLGQHIAIAGDLFGQALAAGDFDGNGITDLAIGIPGRSIQGVSNAGAVLVLFGVRNVGPTFGVSKVFSELTFIPSVESGDGFGSVLAAKDFDGDGRDDLAMGVPNKNVREHAHAGAVFVQHSDRGPLIGRQQFWEQNTIFGSAPNRLFGSPTEGESQFGFSLAAGDFNGDGRADLAIGAPFERIVAPTVPNGNVLKFVQKAGEVDVIYGSASGLSVTAHVPQAWRESMPNSVSEAAPGDQFGFSLTAWNFGHNQLRVVGGNPPHFAVVQTADLAIGVPFKNVGNSLEAGAVQVIYGSFPVDLFSANGLSSANNQLWTESSPGMPTTAVFHDHFGKAVY